MSGGVCIISLLATIPDSRTHSIESMTSLFRSMTKFFTAVFLRSPLTIVDPFWPSSSPLSCAGKSFVSSG